MWSRDGGGVGAKGAGPNSFAWRRPIGRNIPTPHELFHAGVEEGLDVADTALVGLNYLWLETLSMLESIAG